MRFLNETSLNETLHKNKSIKTTDKYCDCTNHPPMKTVWSSKKLDSAWCSTNHA